MKDGSKIGEAELSEELSIISEISTIEGFLMIFPKPQRGNDILHFVNKQEEVQKLYYYNNLQ